VRGFIALEIRRSLRDVRYLVIAVMMPVGLYLLFSGLFGSHGNRAQGLPQPVELMVAMVTYGAMWAVFSSTGPRVANERAIGWTRQLRVSPLSATHALVAKLASALVLALPAMVLVCLTAMISHHVLMSPIRWGSMLLVVWIGVVPLAILGLAVGYLVGDEIAFAVSMALYFVLGALGGLWMPLSTMPHAMQDIAHLLPSNGTAELGWAMVGGRGAVASAALVLGFWALGGMAVGFLAYRCRVFTR
jgi:ABC-2 type transport system permease protein